jgi:hypothetical protein
VDPPTHLWPADVGEFPLLLRPNNIAHVGAAAGVGVGLVAQGDACGVEGDLALLASYRGLCLLIVQNQHRHQ